MNADDVACAAQLAILLEVSGWPKPGCVHRTADFKKTRFEHFLAAASAVGPVFKGQTELGIKVGDGSINFSELKVGLHIKEAVLRSLRWQSGGNTNLGTLMLFMPLTAAVGKLFGEGSNLEIKLLQKNLEQVLKSTTVQDSLDLVEAIKLAAPGGLGKVPELDVYEESTIAEIKIKNIAMYNLMEKSAPYDRISEEWVTCFKISFDFGYPTLLSIYENTKDINLAIVATFLYILASYPDTLIARKVGKEKAKEISEEAKEIFALGYYTKEFFQRLHEFDKKLRAYDNKLNPGTTADLTATSIFIALLLGLRL